MTRAFLAALASCTLAACSSGIDTEAVLDSLGTVATLRGNTMSDLRQQRGRGPFREYDVPPLDLLSAVEEAAGRARGRGGRRVTAIFASKGRREVVAKERAAEDANDASYDAPFLSAMLAVVHTVPGNPKRSRLEIHMTHSGPFHIGAVDWRRDLPGWIDAVLAERAADATAAKDAAKGAESAATNEPAASPPEPDSPAP